MTQRTKATPYGPTRYDRLAQRLPVGKTRWNRWERIHRADQLRLEREHDRRARPGALFVDVAFEVDLYLGGVAGKVSLLRPVDQAHRTAPLGRYICIRIA